MKRLSVLLMSAILFFSVSLASAGLIIQVDNDLYEINTITGLLSTHRSTIESQVWFGNTDLARLFANEVGTQLGTPNFGLGPVFGYYIYDGAGADYTTGWFYKPSNYHLAPDNRAQVQNASAGNYHTYAVADHIPSPVPVPTTILLFGTGLAGLVGMGYIKRQ